MDINDPQETHVLRALTERTFSANPPGDAPDCSNLVIAELDFDAVFWEMEAQYLKAGELERKIWITHIEEGIGRLEDEFSAIVHIGNRISALADEYRERMYQNLKTGEPVDS